MVFEICPRCDDTLDPFGQCFRCDTWGAPETRPHEPAAPEKRCTVCRSVHSEPNERCDYCEGHGITPEMFEEWAAECDDLRTDAYEGYCS